jgi:hypothetical protein
MNTLGEHSSVAEELLIGITDIEQKCRAVLKSVKEGFFTLDEALEIYKLNDSHYNSFIEKSNNDD